MKDNLLIALGDSNTYGLGAYTDEALESYSRHKNMARLQSQSDSYSRDNAWPVQLARMLDWDVLNLGLAGTANSAHARYLIDRQQTIKEYKQVTVIWLLTDPSRFSLYSMNEHSQQGILSIIPSMILSKQADWGSQITQLAESYTALSSVTDAIKDTEFYIRIVEQYCQLKGYSFMYGNAFTSIPYNGPNCLHNYHGFSNMFQWLDCMGFRDIYAPCGHPTALGHKLIAEEIARCLESRNREAPSAKF